MLHSMYYATLINSTIIIPSLTLSPYSSLWRASMMPFRFVQVALKNRLSQSQVSILTITIYSCTSINL